MTEYGKDLTTTGKYKANLMGRIYALIIDYELVNGLGSATRNKMAFKKWLVERLKKLGFIYDKVKNAE